MGCSLPLNTPRERLNKAVWQTPVLLPLPRVEDSECHGVSEAPEDEGQLAPRVHDTPGSCPLRCKQKATWQS
ncbi:hypothetical protein Y1Q_0010138 [Alligator mississippiensis]|uniref:Uncharacterized protein n=1 Tax=Alligator mississippiensis TaxID=8496 RepID=A0A151NFV8_ALLMI|nr:hypothetical protein Y1Q_0010138 [Alligator mississippiensis]